MSHLIYFSLKYWSVSVLDTEIKRWLCSHGPSEGHLQLGIVLIEKREVFRMKNKEIKCARVALAVLSIDLSKHSSCCALSRGKKLCCQIHNVINS